MVTLSRESWFIEHDGTSQLGSMVTVSRNGHSVTQRSQRHVNRDPVNTMGHHSWDQRSQCYAMVTLSRKSWFIEHDGTSKLGSGVRVSLESLSIEHDETTCVMRRCHVCAGKADQRT